MGVLILHRRTVSAALLCQVDRVNICFAFCLVKGSGGIRLRDQCTISVRTNTHMFI